MQSLNNSAGEAVTKVTDANAAARRRLLTLPREPLFYADWERAVFIHYEVEARRLQQDVPFALDLRDGRAFVSLVAFTMRNMRPRVGGTLAEWLLKPIATHAFLNVRTYVRHRGEPGIHFLAEWLSNRWSVNLGPCSFGLPYRFGHLNYEHLHENGELRGQVWNGARTQRLSYRARLNGRFPSAFFAQSTNALLTTNQSLEPVGLIGRVSPLRAVSQKPSRSAHGVTRPTLRFVGSNAFCPSLPGTLEGFLLERYTAFTRHGRTERFFRIWHPPWPQTSIDVTVEENSLLTANWPWFSEARLVDANYSPGVKNVCMGWPHKTSKLTALPRRSPRCAFWEMP